MAENVKLNEMLDASLAQTGEESSMLLGQQLRIAQGDSLNTNKTSYFAGMDDAIFVAGVESREEYPGQFYMIFSLRDAILLSGLLLGIPVARVSEKRKLAILEADDVDAFGEILNQVIGSFNSVFKQHLPNKIHLKLQSPKKFIPGIDEMSENEPLPEDEYVLFRAQMNMDGVEMDRLDIMIPRSLSQLIDPPQVDPGEPEIVTESASTEQKPDAAIQSMQLKTIVLIEDDEQVRQQMTDSLKAAGLLVVDASFKDDIRQIFAQNDTGVAVIGVADTEDRELALCIKINAMHQDTPLPIIMCAPQWTRSGVLKAIKYGARDIILKPYVASELVDKVSRFLKAA